METIIHELKTWPNFFNSIMWGSKSFEVRKNDRDFQMGDMLVLKEWDPVTEKYTGRSLMRQIGYILKSDEFPELGDLVVMSVIMV